MHRPGLGGRMRDGGARPAGAVMRLRSTSAASPRGAGGRPARRAGARAPGPRRPGAKHFRTSLRSLIPGPAAVAACGLMESKQQAGRPASRKWRRPLATN